MINSKNSMGYSHVNYRICRAQITDLTTAYQPGPVSGIICENCHSKFPKEDIDLMANLFIAYGGYFGQKNEQKKPILQVMKDMMSELRGFQDKLDAQGLKKLNIKLIHRALIFGIPLQRYIRLLEYFLTN